MNHPPTKIVRVEFHYYKHYDSRPRKCNKKKVIHDPIFNVEAFLEVKGSYNNKEYLVKWEGYDRDCDNTWEPAHRLLEDLGQDTFEACVIDMYKRRGEAIQLALGN